MVRVYKISNPPTSAEIASARDFSQKNLSSMGGWLAANVALSIFQMAQCASPAEVDSFIAEIKNTKTQTKHGPIPLASWIFIDDEWKLFVPFIENWRANAPFPLIPGVTP